MSQRSPVAGKTIAMTGKFAKLKRAEAEAQLAALGAIISSSLTRKVDILIYGDKAGSKIATAQSYGTELHDEAWLEAILAGEDPTTAASPVDTLKGPLSDYVARLLQYAQTLRENPRLKVGLHCTMSGAHPDRIARQAKDWKLDQFEPAITNLYAQTNGFCLSWIDTLHPEFKEQWSPYEHHAYLNQLYNDPLPSTRAPSSRDLESFPWHMGGIVWILPLEDALKLREGFFTYNYGIVAEDEEVEAYGRIFHGEQLERGVRVFDAGLHYYPVGFLMDPPLEAPPVIIGDDYGACWTDSRIMTFEDYLEGLLNTHFVLPTRRAMVTGYNPNEGIRLVRPAPTSINEHLVQRQGELKISPEGTYKIEVMGVETIDAMMARAYMLLGLAEYRLKDVIKALGEKATSKDPLEQCLQIAPLTTSAKAMDMAMVKKVMTAAYQSSKTKKAMAEAFFEDQGEAKRITLKITTCFEAQNIRGAELDEHSERVAKDAIGEATMRTRFVLAKGKKTREMTVEVIVPLEHQLEVGTVIMSQLTPYGVVKEGEQYFVR